jgi:transcriptional regulator with XRE-family HTH domain
MAEQADEEDGALKRQIGQRIAELRQAHRLSQPALAAKIGSRASTISRWEQGDTTPTATNLVPLLLALGVSPDEFFKGVHRPLDLIIQSTEARAWTVYRDHEIEPDALELIVGLEERASRVLAMQRFFDESFFSADVAQGIYQIELRRQGYRTDRSEDDLQRVRNVWRRRRDRSFGPSITTTGQKSADYHVILSLNELVMYALGLGKWATFSVDVRRSELGRIVEAVRASGQIRLCWMQDVDLELKVMGDHVLVAEYDSISLTTDEHQITFYQSLFARLWENAVELLREGSSKSEILSKLQVDKMETAISIAPLIQVVRVLEGLAADGPVWSGAVLKVVNQAVFSPLVGI